MSTENFEQETEKSPWKKVHPSFKVHSIFYGGKNSNYWKYKNKIFNQIRLVIIQGLAYLEVKTQKPEITFLYQISDYTKLQQHVWYAHKNNNTYYIETNIKKDNKQKILQFH